MSKPSVDVAVIGGGPAGAVTALRLAHAGASVRMYERSRYDELRMGETLPPAVNPLLRGLDLWDRFLTLKPVPSYQTASAWGGPDILERSFIMSPHGHGWHVNRAAFDEMLSQAASDAGVDVHRSVSVRRVDRSADDGMGFVVDAAENSDRARTVIDATGRSASVARRLGAVRGQLDHLTSVARIFQLGSDQPVTDTFIEGTETGWWYVSPLPAQQRLIACFTDAPTAAELGLGTVGGWNEALDRTSHTRLLAVGQPLAGTRIASAASHQLSPVWGDGWVAVGDAALAVDPLSSGGVSFALRSADHAAKIALGESPLAYAAMVSDAASEYRRLRADIYGWERRFEPASFWTQRSALDEFAVL